MRSQVDPSFWNNKCVFLTGHTGFKGGWLSLWLVSMGAKVTGYALPPNTTPNLFTTASINAVLKKSHIGDISDLNALKVAVNEARPDFLIHMAAQPLVRYSYESPLETYQTNVMGTVHVLEAVRSCPSIKAVLIVTTDKCYENQEWVWGYRESEPMGGHDPYSSSKGCAELVTAAYRQSFFPESKYEQHGVAIATCRAGNVIGGGDWSADRLIPDALRAFEKGRPLVIRNPGAIRPWQHVLEPISGYLILAQQLYEYGPKFNGSWNFGPQDSDARTVAEVVNLMMAFWEGNASWKQEGSDASNPHEAHFLKLDCSKAKQQLGWSAKWPLEKAVDTIVTWHQAFYKNSNIKALTLQQIEEYMVE
jgi:CDP-glucose 4,6-dehydratase